MADMYSLWNFIFQYLVLESCPNFVSHTRNSGSLSLFSVSILTKNITTLSYMWQNKYIHKGLINSHVMILRHSQQRGYYSAKTILWCQMACQSGMVMNAISGRVLTTWQPEEWCKLSALNTKYKSIYNTPTKNMKMQFQVCRFVDVWAYLDNVPDSVMDTVNIDA